MILKLIIRRYHVVTNLVFNRQTDGLTGGRADGRTDGQTDSKSYTHGLTIFHGKYMSIFNDLHIILVKIIHTTYTIIQLSRRVRGKIENCKHGRLITFYVFSSYLQEIIGHLMFSV